MLTRRRVALGLPVLAVAAVAAAYGVFALLAGGGAPPLRLELRGGGVPADGSWRLVVGPSVVGYRVRERLTYLPAPHDAVGRTSRVAGTLTLSGGEVRALEVRANLATLESDSSERDAVLLHEGPQFARFPRAAFVLAHPVRLVQGTATATGELTLHGVGRSVEVPFGYRATRTRLELVGRITIRFADFGFGPPRRPIVRIGGSGTIEFRLRFRHAA